MNEIHQRRIISHRLIIEAAFRDNRGFTFSLEVHCSNSLILVAGRCVITHGEERVCFQCLSSDMST